MKKHDVKEEIKGFQDEVARFVANRLFQLKNSSNESNVRATLARLRRGLGKAPGELPELWDFTLEDLPEVLLSQTEEPTYGEWAIHVALSLFAYHQQGKDLNSQYMHQDSGETQHSIGTACCTLKARKEEDAVKRRFNILATSDSFTELVHHLRSLIGLLKSEDIPLDYVLLAKELYFFQFPQWRNALRLRWGQDFYAFKEEGALEDNDNNSDTVSV